MKQILQNLKTGKLETANLPIPARQRGQLLIKTNYSLVSAGTERMLVEFAKSNLFEKARAQPDKVRMVLDKIKTDGLQPTIESVLNKLDSPLPLGYCNVGHVVDFGEDVKGFEIGDRVISNGKHAEVVSVPVNLCAKIPRNVSDKNASFTVLASVALQSLRLINPTLGETIVVIGLGLVGLMAIQLLKANGCRVIGVDYDTKKLKIAKQFGAEIIDLSKEQDPVEFAKFYSKGRGVDAVLIAASTKSNTPIEQAALMCRKRGRIVLVGVSGLKLSRDVFFKKELTFQVSASYGPGRYDPNYEEKGQDYPIGFVRWTEQRNFEAILEMMAEGKLNFESLISNQFRISEAEKAYKLVMSKEYSLGILLKYNKTKITKTDKTVFLPFIHRKKENIPTRLYISFLGAGNHALSTLIPAFNSSNTFLYNIASNSGISGLHAARKFKFLATTTDPEEIINDKKTSAIVITTKHDSHADLVIRGLECGKNIFVEKPLCLTFLELEKIKTIYNKATNSANQPPILMVGFNRRFSPLIVKAKKLLDKISEPKSFIMSVNAGAVPKDHWVHDYEKGGGRIVGEACHFIDLLLFLNGSPIKNCSKLVMDSVTNDTISINIKFENGSIGTIHYFANGSKSYPKERLEIFASGRILQLNNHRELIGYGWPNFTKTKLWRQDKGHHACVQAFIDAIINNKPNPIPIDEIFEVSQSSIEINK